MKGRLNHTCSQRVFSHLPFRRNLSPTSDSQSQHLPPIQAHPPRRSFASTLPLKVSKGVDLRGLGRYVLYRTIGTGSFARVKLAMDKVTGQAVVVKVISKDIVLKRKQLAHVLTENRLLAQLHHPLLVAHKSSFQDNFFLYMVLEYVPGGELYTLLAKTGFIEPHDARIYACEVVCALAYLHSLHMAYRDIKPENILITASGHIKLTDFGFLKQVQGKTYTLCGTPEYLAPELINREGHDLQCDWWALGVLLYEMLVGRPPFQAASPFELYEQILTQAVRYPPNLPADVRSLMESLLRKNPHERASEAEIRACAYFSGINWDQAAQCHLQPHYRPQIKSPFDASNFDKYPEVDLPLDERKSTDPTLFAEF